LKAHFYSPGRDAPQLQLLTSCVPLAAAQRTVTRDRSHRS